MSEKRHTVAAILGIVFLLAIVSAGAINYGYVPSAEIGGLTETALALVAVLILIASLGAYVIEDR